MLLGAEDVTEHAPVQQMEELLQGHQTAALYPAKSGHTKSGSGAEVGRTDSVGGLLPSDGEVCL